jgi:hypothetical protein
LRDHIEVALNAPLQIHKDFGNLLAGQDWRLECRTVLVIDLIANPLSYHADVPCGVLQAYHVFQRSGQLAEETAQKYVAVEGHLGLLNDS